MEPWTREPVVSWENSGEFILQGMAERHMPNVVQQSGDTYDLGQSTP